MQFERNVFFPDSEERVVQLFMSWDWVESEEMARKMVDQYERGLELYAREAGMNAEDYRTWSETPSSHFGGLTPRQIVEHEVHDYDSLWNYFEDLTEGRELKDSYL